MLIVGAGDGGRLLLREILRNPELGYRPGRLHRRRPAQARARASTAGSRCSARPTSSRRVLDDVEPRRGADRDPVGAGHDARAAWSPPAASAACRCARCRPCSSCCRPAGGSCARCARSRSRTSSGASRCGWRSSCVGELPDRPGRPRHRRGRLDRLRAVPPDRARAAARGWSCSTTPRTTCSRSSASWSRTGTRSTPCAVLADCKEEERMREVFARAPPDRRLPRRRLQARRADGEQPGRGGAQQRARHARDVRASPATSGCSAFVLVSTDKAVAPATVMGASKALAEWAVEAADARYPETPLRDRALRQRARLVRLGRADLPPPDRRGRAR